MLLSFFAIIIYFNFLFLIGTYRRNNGTADVGWGLGFILIALCALYVSNAWSLALLVGVGLIIVWGLRLTAHLYIRQRGEPEDRRYQKFREGWGNHPILNAYFKVYIVQALVAFIVALPIMLLGVDEKPIMTWVAWVLVVLALAGISYEAVADYQLYAFKLKPENKGQRLMSGLWAYSRHPNYFGELLFWWAFGFYVLVTTGYLYALIGPLVLNLIIYFVSGVPLIDKSKNLSESHTDYIQHVPAIIPRWLWR